MTNPARIAEATVCDATGCDTGHLMVRGDRIGFLSQQRYKQLLREGYTRRVEQGSVIWEPEMPDSDVKLPAGYVLVHDTTGKLLSKCDLYVLRWRGQIRSQLGTNLVNEQLLADARDYFVDADGGEIKPALGSVEIPAGSWTKVATVKFIRYRRAGHPKPFEHEYEPAVEVHDSSRVLAWRLPLPTGCVVDSRGFVWP